MLWSWLPGTMVGPGLTADSRGPECETERRYATADPSPRTEMNQAIPQLRTSFVLGFLCAMTAVDLVEVSAQDEEPTVVTTAAGARYSAGALHRWILGRHYRDLWTQPIRVEVLDLDAIGGGLTPTRTGGGMQTRSLRFLGSDGREYAFRSVDKDPSAVLDTLLQGTVVADLVRDGISAAHPFGALVASPLMDAVGVLHVDPQLRIMPDDPRLGEFRAEFAGMLGLIEERPDENEGDRTAFRGSERVIASEALTERLDEGPDDQVDAHAFLKARLLDVFLGDWDRHRGQWRWATYDESSPRTWLPVPRDRDQAFSKFDGLATRLVSLYLLQFVRFEAEYPSIDRLHWNGRALDRWFLSELDRAEWDAIGSEVQAALTDEVIQEAAAQLPQEIFELNGAELESTLRARRDALHEAWDDFYRMMAEKVDIRGTDEDEVVVVDRSEPGVVTVFVQAPTESDGTSFERRFIDSETSEVRIYMREGEDNLIVTGDASSQITVRVIGGEGDDRFDIEGSSAGIALYDFQGQNLRSGADAPSIDDRPLDLWEWSADDRDQPRDWGRRVFPIFSSFYSSDLGPLIGGGARFETYGFQKRGFSTAFDVRGSFAPVTMKGIAEIDGRINAENSALFWTLGGRLSRLDVLSYYGEGNDVDAAGPESFHEVDVTATALYAGLGVSPEPWFELSGDIRVERSSTQDNSGRFFGGLGSVYGEGQFWSLGIGGRITFDPLLGNHRSGHRFRLRMHGTVYPEALDVASTYGRGGADLSVLFASSPWPRLALALRGGAEQVAGRAPWHNAVFIGGTSTLRAWDENRFAGDGAFFGSAEVRLRVFNPRIVVPVGVGVFGFLDAGRVYVDEESPGGWHTGKGGGLVFHPIQQENILRIGFGRSEEATKVFVAIGLPY